MAFDITGQLNLRLASGAVRQIANEINSGLRASGVGAVNVPVRADTNAIRSVVSEIGQATNAVERFAQQSGLAFKRFTAFSVAAIPFIQVASGIRSAIGEAVEFDRQMVRLRQVAIGAGSEVGAIGKEVSRLSINLGISSQDLIKTAVTLKQANLSINETRDALEALAKSALAPNFDSIEQTVEGAIAVMNQFKVKSKDMEAALGSMNAVAGEFAVEAGDLIEVVRRAGGAFAATGGNLNELLSLFTSVRQTTRESAESIATGLRTIFTRIQRNDTVESLKQIGVNLRYTREEAAKTGNLGLEDQFVGAYEAVRRLSTALTQLPQADPRYSAIVENLGGYRQISKVIPLIQEFAVSERALMVAEAGRVSLTVNAAQAADSYSNRLTRLKESYLEFGRSLMDTQGFKATFGAFEEIAKGILSVTNALQPLMPLITAFAAIRIASNLGSFFRNFSHGASYAGTGNLLGRASGGIVPGVGDTDSVPMSLPAGSFVIKKSSARKLGAGNLRQMGSGAVPTMLTPGEYVFSPEQTRKIGLSKLNHLNNHGSVSGYQEGGEVTDDDLRRLIARTASKKGVSASDDQIEKLLDVVKKSIPHETVMERTRSTIASNLGDHRVPYGLDDDLKKLNKRGLKEIARNMRVKTPVSDIDAIRQAIIDETTKARPPIEIAKRKASLYGISNSFEYGLSNEMAGENDSKELLRKVKKNFISQWESKESRRKGVKVKFPNAKSKSWDGIEEISGMRHYDEIKDSMTRDPETSAFFQGKNIQDADRSLFQVVDPRSQATKIDREGIYKKTLGAAISWERKTFDPTEQAIEKHVQPDPFSQNELSIGKPSNYLARQTTSKEQRLALTKQRAEARKAEKEARAAEKKVTQDNEKKARADARAEARAEAKSKKQEEQERIKQQIRDEKEDEISTGVVSDKPNQGILGDTLGKRPSSVSARRLQFAEVSSLEEKTKMLESSFAQRTGEAGIGDMGPVGMRRLAEKLKKRSLLSQEQYEEIADVVSSPGFSGQAPPSLVAAMKAREQAFEQETKDLAAAQRVVKTASPVVSAQAEQSDLSQAVPIYQGDAATTAPASVVAEKKKKNTSSASVVVAQTKAKAMAQKNEQAKKETKKSENKAKSNAQKVSGSGGDTQRFIETLPINTPLPTEASLTREEAVAAGGGANKPPAKPPAPPSGGEPPSGDQEPPRRLPPRRQGEMFDMAEGILPDNLQIRSDDFGRGTRLTQAQQAVIDNNTAYRPGAGPINFKDEFGTLVDFYNKQDEPQKSNQGWPQRKFSSPIKDDEFKLSDGNEDILPSLESMFNQKLLAYRMPWDGSRRKSNGDPDSLFFGFPTDRGIVQNSSPTIPRQGFHGGYVPPIDNVNDLADDPFKPKRTFGEGLVEYKNSFEYMQKKAEKDFLGSKLDGIGLQKDKLGAVTRTVSTIDSSKMASFLAEMSNKKSGPFASAYILVDHLAKTLERTRPDMSDGSRNKLARSKATDIFRTARKATSYENIAEEAEFRQKQAQERTDNIRVLPQLVEQANLLSDRAKSDPIVKKEYDNILSEIRKVARTVGISEGIDKDKLVGSENGQIKLSTVHQENLNKSAAENDVLAKNAAKQAVEARKKALEAAKSLEGMGASINRDAAGKEAVSFSGSASLFGVDADKSRGSTDDTLARVFEKRMEARLSKLDPSGKGIGDATKEAIQQEEINRLHKEYVEGRRHQIAAEHHLTDMTIATATASEEFAHAMENGTRVVEQQSASGKTVVHKNPYDRNITGAARKGSYEELINQRLEEEISRVSPNGATLPKQTIDRLRSTVTDRTNEQILGSLNAHVRAEHGVTDSLVSQEMAHQRLTEIIKENGSVRLQNNRAVAAETADLGRQGGLSKLSNLASSAGARLKTLFTSDTGFFALQAGASFVGDAVNRSAGNADVAVESGRENSFAISRASGSAISGAGIGASVMQAAGFGPVGMAVGAASAAVMMFTSSIKDASNELSQSKIAISQKQINDALSNFSKGTANLNPELIRSKQNTIDAEMSTTAQRNASVFGLGYIYSNENFNAELDKQKKESAAVSVPAQMDALTKIIEEQAKNNLGNENIKDDKKRLELFRDAIYKTNQGLGASMLGRVASGTQQDFSLLEKKLFDSFKRIQENEQTRITQMKTESNVNNSAATFGNFASAISVATQSLQNMANSTKNVADIMDGTVSVVASQNIIESVQRPFLQDNGEFINAVKSLTNMAGVGGGDIEKSASVIAAAGRDLPSIINAVRSQPASTMATGTNFGIQVSDLLRQSLESQKLDPSQITSVTQMIQGQLGEEDFTKILRETGQDMGKLIQKLLGPIADPLKQSFSDIAKNINERSRIFADGLSELANRMRVSGELIDKANYAEMAGVRNKIQVGLKRGLISEEAADTSIFQIGLGTQQAKLERLTGFGGAGSNNPQFIASALGGVLDGIRGAEEKMSKATKSGSIAEQNSAAIELASLKTKAVDLGQALKNLTDVSERTSQAQEKLTKIQSDKEGKQALGLRYATANTEGRAEIATSFRLVEAAARMGTASSFSTRQQNQIFSLLSSLSPQMKMTGLGGISVKELTSQLLKTTFGGSFDLDPQTAALERALDNFVQNNYDIATEAARTQAEIQQKLQSDFFSTLQANQQTFLTSMSKMMEQNAKNALATQQLMAANRVGELEKNIGNASVIGKLGIQTDDEFTAFKGVLKNPEMSKLMEAGVRTAEVGKSIRRVEEGSDRFAANLAGSVGDKNVKETMGGAAGSIKSQLEELGVTNQEDKNNIIAQMDKFLRTNNVNGDFKNQQDQVKKALISATQSVFAEKFAAANLDMRKSKNELAQSTAGKLPDKVFENLINEIQKGSETFNLTTIEKSISAVESMNVSFTKMNEMLNEARIKLDEFNKAVGGVDAGGAGVAGGPVRFFNKGGWGSGGSLASHSSDTINARISPNEFVVSAGPAQRNRKLLERINSGYAEGGEVDPRKNIGAIQEISKMDTSNILNPDAFSNAVAQAKKIARLNSEALFLSQLKGMKPEDRSKFIFDQSEKLKAIAGKENNEQLGIKDAIEKILAANNKVESTYSTSNLANYYDASQTAAIGLSLKNAPFELEKQIGHLQKIGEYSEMLINRVDPRLQQMSDVDTDFKAKNKFSLTDTIRQTPRLKSHEWITDPNALSQKIDQNLLRYEFGSLKGERQGSNDAKRFLASVRQQFSAFFDNGEISHPRALVDLDILHKRYGGDPKSLRTEAITEHLDRWYQSTKSSRALNQTKASDFVGDIKGHLGGKDQEIDKIIDDATKKILNEKEKIKQVEAIKEGAKKVSNQRASAFKTPAEGISNILSDRGDKKFGREQDAKLMQLQLMSIEAEAFNKLNPAIQSKLLEQKRQKIEEGKLSPTEKGQMVQSGLWDAISSTKDITAEEIKGFAENRSKMTLVQRAALEILMTRALAGSKEKIDKDPDSLSAAEKAAYLISLDSQGRKEAFEAFNDRNNVVLFTRIGQFISSNPGGIQTLLSKAQENGPAAYAKEAALLEMISASFGAPTTLPKASEAYKDKSLRSKAQAEAAGKPNVAKDAAAIIGAGMAGAQAGVAGAAAAAGVAAPKQDQQPVLFGVDEAAKRIPAFASGGLVPGVGNTDSVRANLPVGSYVIRKSSVQKMGAENLAALPHLAKGGVVPAMVMPGEHIFTPSEASKIGKSNLDHINQKGSLSGYEKGGPIVVNGIRYMPVGTEKWGQRDGNSLGFQPQTIKDNGNPLAPKNNSGQGMTEGQFLAIEAINQNIGDGGGITALKAKFFSLRDSMRDPRRRTKENIAQLRQMYATLTNPMVVQMDAQRQMMGAQEAFASFQQDPKAFIAKSKELRALAANAKATMEERVAAKEQLNQMNHAARFIDPRALTAAASAAQKQQKQQQQQQKAADDPLQGGLFRLDPTLAAHKMAPAPNGVEAHDARVRAGAQGQQAPDRKAAEASHLKKMLEIAQENYFKTGDPKFLQEINKIKNPDKVRAEEKSVAQTTMDDHRAKKGQEAEENKIGQWHVREGIEDIRDPGGVKRSAEKLQRFYAEKNKNREEFESKVFARAPTYDEFIQKRDAGQEERQRNIDSIRMQQDISERNKKRKIEEDKRTKDKIAFDELQERKAKVSSEMLRDGIDSWKVRDKMNEMTSGKQEGPNHFADFLAKREGRAAGGIVTGVGSGDTVPAMLEPGELVVPKKHVQKFANGGIVGGIQGFANGGMAQGGGPELLDVAAKFNQAATQISQGLSGFSTSVSTFNGAVASFGTFVDKFDEAVGKIPGQIELSGANEISVNLMGQDSIVKAVTEAIGPMIAEAIRANQPVEQRSQ